jgi:hypothetical protein
MVGTVADPTNCGWALAVAAGYGGKPTLLYDLMLDA